MGSRLMQPRVGRPSPNSPAKRRIIVSVAVEDAFTFAYDTPQAAGAQQDLIRPCPSGVT